MLRCLLCALSLFVATTSVQAAPRELTVFSDGILAELEATAKKGVIELQLPGQIREGTVRVKPLEGGRVVKVELLPSKVPDKLQKELDLLTEQKKRSEDRLKALDTREGIFAAAAKSQSSKAPRKTKSNPDPLASVRQGTDFAIAQLEAVFTARRRTEQELKRLETRLVTLRKKAIGGPIIQVTMAPATARARIAAILQEGGWKPSYEIRLQGTGTATLKMFATLSNVPEGYGIKIVPAALAAGQPQQILTLPANGSHYLKEWQLPVEEERVVSSPLPSFHVTIKNNSNQPLASGLAAIYFSGEYIGTAQLPATTSGASATLTN